MEGMVMYAKHINFVRWIMNTRGNDKDPYLKYVETVKQKDVNVLRDIRNKISKCLTELYLYRDDIEWALIYKTTLNLHHRISNIISYSNDDNINEWRDMREEQLKSRREYEDDP